MKKQISLIFLLSIITQSLIAQVLGLDVYGGNNNNQAIIWQQVRQSGRTFAWAKATKGLCYTDARIHSYFKSKN